MNIPTTSANQRIVLIKSHCRQWKSFFADQIKARQALAHAKERAGLGPLSKNYSQLAKLIKRQMNELFDLRIKSQKMHACLADTQQREREGY